MGHFCPPGSGSGSGFRIRIRIQWPDWIRIQSGSGYGSGSATLYESAEFRKKPLVRLSFYMNFIIVKKGLSPYKVNTTSRKYLQVSILTYIHYHILQNCSMVPKYRDFPRDLNAWIEQWLTCTRGSSLLIRCQILTGFYLVAVAAKNN